MRTQAGRGVSTSSSGSNLRKLWRGPYARAIFLLGQRRLGLGRRCRRLGLGRRPQGLRELCATLAKFTRNLVAGVPANQLRA